MLLGSDGQSASKQPSLNTAETAMPPSFGVLDLGFFTSPVNALADGEDVADALRIN